MLDDLKGNDQSNFPLSVSDSCKSQRKQQSDQSELNTTLKPPNALQQFASRATE